MTDPTARTLRLLDLLQTHRRWSGPDLASRLGVSLRTLRRDVDRLRELGYVVDSAPGEVGGYQLSAGSTLPPLLLDDEEAVALAVGLRTAAVSGRGAEAGVRTMAKIDALLPAHLRRRAAALAESVVTLGHRPQADASTLGELALACRDHERVRFGYRDQAGTQSRRHAEPHRLVVRSGRWYLLARDVDRAEWRTFRVDRLQQVLRTGARFAPQELDEEQVGGFFTVADRTAYRAVVTIEVPLDQALAHFRGWAGGMEGVEVDGRPAVRWPLTGATPQDIFGALVWIPPGWAWTVDADAEVAALVTGLRDRLAQVRIGPAPGG